MGWALHQGLKCLLIKSQLRLEPALPPPPRPRGRHTQPSAGAAPWEASPLSPQPTASGVNTAEKGRKTFRRGTKAPRHPRDRDGWARPSAGQQRGLVAPPTPTPTPRPGSGAGSSLSPLRRSFLLCPAGLVPVSDPPAFDEMRLSRVQCRGRQRVGAPPRLQAADKSVDSWARPHTH